MSRTFRSLREGADTTIAVRRAGKGDHRKAERLPTPSLERPGDVPESKPIRTFGSDKVVIEEELPEPASQARPWEWSWFKWQPGEFSTMFWIFLLHAGALAAIVLTPVPGWEIFWIACGLSFLGGFGTTVGYHRALAHKAVRLRKPAEFVLTFLAMMNGSGTPSTWSANHRLHHSRADKQGDISAPGLGGFWWSHLRWLWQAEHAKVERWAPDLDTPYYRLFRRCQIPLLALSFFAGLPWGLAAFLWIGPLRLCISLHAQCFVNSIAHMRPDAKPGEDSSQNIGWLGLLQFYQGENWHGNHHAQPWSARLGWTWWQVDFGWTLIRLMEVTGLATKVNRPIKDFKRASGTQAEEKKAA
ncbi:MAG: acyl-CoA desaturase [Planctomycetota bacterium]|jgi:stearoyl-CoA desaturase (delta-9 desaturase)